MANNTEAKRLKAIEHLNKIFPRENFWALDDDDGTICCNAPAPDTLTRVYKLGDSGALLKFKTATIGWTLMVESGDLNLLREAAETEKRCRETIVAALPLSSAQRSVPAFARRAQMQPIGQPGR